MTENVAADRAEEAVKAEEAVPAGQANEEAATAAAATEGTAAAPAGQAAGSAAEPEKNPLERSVEFKVSKAAFEAAYREELKGYRKKALFPGFRRGHVPMARIESVYGQQASSDTLDRLGGEECNKALRGLGLPVAGTPQVSGGRLDETGENMVFTATFETYPVIDLPDFSTVELKKYECTVDDEAIDRTISVMIKQRATFEEEEGRRCGGEDRVTLDFRGTRDGEPFDGGSAENFVFQLGQGRMLPDFEAGITGLAAGEKKSFPLTFPENYGAKDLAGREVEFAVEVKKVERPVYPELNEEFARSLGAEDVGRMREEVGRNLAREVKTRVIQRNKAEVMLALGRLLDFPMPQVVVNAEAEGMLEAAKADISRQGNKELLKSLNAGMFRRQAEQRVKLGLIVGRIAAAAGIEVTRDDVYNAAREISEAYQEPQQFIDYILKDDEQTQRIRSVTVENKVVDYVLEKGRTTVETIPFDSLMSGPAA